MMQTTIPDISVAVEGVLDGCGSLNITDAPKNDGYASHATYLMLTC
jgi:uncharacterized protein YceK